MHVFRHPKFYDELRKKRKEFLRQQAQAQAGEAQATETQASSSKLQAQSRKQQAPGYFFPDKVLQRQESGSLLR